MSDTTNSEMIRLHSLLTDTGRQLREAQERCERFEGALVNMLWQYGGVNDCVDNAGERYQSEAAYQAECEARAALNTKAKEE